MSTPRQTLSAPRQQMWIALLALVAGVGIVWAADLAGLWWAATPVGFAIGLIVRRGRAALGVAGLAGLLGWGLPLTVAATSVPIGRTASVTAGIMGLGTASGPIVILVTLLLGLLLALSGAWIGVALRLLFISAQHRPKADRPAR